MAGLNRIGLWPHQKCSPWLSYPHTHSLALGRGDQLSVRPNDEDVWLDDFRPSKKEIMSKDIDSWEAPAAKENTDYWWRNKSLDSLPSERSNPVLVGSVDQARDTAGDVEQGSKSVDSKQAKEEWKAEEQRYQGERKGVEQNRTARSNGGLIGESARPAVKYVSRTNSTKIGSAGNFATRELRKKYMEEEREPNNDRNLETDGDDGQSEFEKRSRLKNGLPDSTRGNNDLLKRTNLIAKQVISISSAASLGFISQLWVDCQMWKVRALEVKQSFLFGEVEGVLLTSVYKVGDVILVQDENALEGDLLVPAFNGVIGNDILTEDGAYLGKVRDYFFNFIDGKVHYIEFDSLGVSFIPSNMVNTYSLSIEEVVESASDALLVRKGAAGRMRRLTKGLLQLPFQPKESRLLESRSYVKQGAKKISGMNQRVFPDEQKLRRENALAREQNQFGESQPLLNSRQRQLKSRSSSQEQWLESVKGAKMDFIASDMENDDDIIGNIEQTTKENVNAEPDIRRYLRYTKKKTSDM